MDKHSELYFALERLGFKKPKYIEKYLVMYHSFNQGDIYKRSQYGGGKTTKIHFGKYIFNCVVDKYDYKYSYGSEDNQCILLAIPRENINKEVYIQTLSNTGDCDVRDAKYNKKGKFLLELALAFIDKILKKTHKLKIITLRDTSYKTCKNGKNILMADMYFLLNGHTWYGAYGFVPCDITTKKIDFDRLEKYKKNRKIFKTTYVKDYESILKKYLHKYNNGFLKDSMIDKVIEKCKDMLLGDFFKKLLKHYEEACEIFERIYKMVMMDLRMYSFNGDSFMKLLD